MTRYVVNRLLSGLVTPFLFLTLLRRFYLPSLGLKDAAFRGSDRHRSRWARQPRSHSVT